LLFGELSTELQLSSDVARDSAFRTSLGFRQRLGARGLSLEVTFDALLGPRPDLSDVTRLIPTEPRATLSVGLRYQLEPAPRAALAAPPSTTPQAAPAPAPPPSARLELSLLDDHGQPRSGARVTLQRDGREQTLSEKEPGSYALQGTEPGRAKLRIVADGFEPVEKDIELGAGAPLRLGVSVEPTLPPGQVRGLVRTFAGKGLAANVRVEPLGVEAQSDADGFFQIDVPPGEYEVVIESPGYAPQRRKATVVKQGVVIVNADLAKEAP
jgi:hypothetical protein